MIFPVSHEQSTSRRWPWVTMLLVLVCTAVMIPYSRAVAEHDTKLGEAVAAALQFYHLHPTLRASDSIHRWDMPYVVELKKAVIKSVEAVRPASTVDAVATADHQRRLDLLTAEVERLMDEHPRSRYGIVSTDFRPWALVTHVFVHNGWPELIINMWFLWLFGSTLEDRWGHAVYLAILATSVTAAAVVHGVMSGFSHVPMVGSAGGVAGMVGAFTVVFASSKVQFLVVLLYRSVFLKTTAYVLVPVWLVTQALYGFLFVGTAIPIGAYLGGFGFGALAGGVLKLTKLDQPLANGDSAAGDAKQHPLIVQAGELTASGNPVAAIKILKDIESRGVVNDVDIHLELLRAAKAAKDPEVEVEAYCKLIDLCLRERADYPAFGLYLELKWLKHEARLPRNVHLRLAERLAVRGDDNGAAAAYSLLHEDGLTDVVAVEAAVGHAGIAMKQERVEESRALFLAARESPFSTVELDHRVDLGLGRLDRMVDKREG